jgi:hypothetical protein
VFLGQLGSSREAALRPRSNMTATIKAATMRRIACNARIGLPDGRGSGPL